MIEYKQFKNEYAQDAAKVFIDNYQELRKTYKELPNKYESNDVITKKLIETIKSNPAVIALSDGKVLGYITGYSSIPHFKGSSKGVYIPEWAHSSITDNNKTEIYYGLYKMIAKEWISDNCYNQAVTFFANDIVLKEFLFNLGFGLLVVDGLRPVEEIPIIILKDIIYREATKQDLPSLIALRKKLNEHLYESPINRFYKDTANEEYEKDFFSSNILAFVGEKDGKIIACMKALLNDGSGCDIVKDSGTIGINFAYTNREIQGSGIGTLLLEEFIKWGINNNMKRCSVDFESQNQKGSNFWLRYFKPVCYSVIRKIDDRIG